MTSNTQSLPEELQIYSDVDGSLYLVQCMRVIQKPRHIRLTKRAVIGARLTCIGEPQVVRILRPPIAALIHIDLEKFPVASLQLPNWDCRRRLGIIKSFSANSKLIRCLVPRGRAS